MSAGPYVVFVEHDYRMWEIAFTHRWRWVCRLVARWNTRSPAAKWWSRNVEIE